MNLNQIRAEKFDSRQSVKCRSNKKEKSKSHLACYLFCCGFFFIISYFFSPTYSFKLLFHFNKKNWSLKSKKWKWEVCCYKYISFVLVVDLLRNSFLEWSSKYFKRYFDVFSLIRTTFVNDVITWPVDNGKSVKTRKDWREKFEMSLVSFSYEIKVNTLFFGVSVYLIMILGTSWNPKPGDIWKLKHWNAWKHILQDIFVRECLPAQFNNFKGQLILINNDNLPRKILIKYECFHEETPDPPLAWCCLALPQTCITVDTKECKARSKCMLFCLVSLFLYFSWVRCIHVGSQKMRWKLPCVYSWRGLTVTF